jgi:hypothetical protein
VNTVETPRKEAVRLRGVLNSGKFGSIGGFVSENSLANRVPRRTCKQEGIMLFMCISTWEPQQAKEAVKKRLEMEAKGTEMPAGLTKLGEWGYIGGGKAFVLLDVQDPASLMELYMAWSDVMKMEAVPVLERKDIAAIRGRLK